MQSFQGRLQERQLRFIHRSKQKVPAIIQALHQLETSPADSELLAHVWKFFHQLAGGAGIYEMELVCQLTIEAENVCLPILKEPAPVEAADLRSLNSYVKAIVEEFDRVECRLSGSMLPPNDRAQSG